MFKILETNITSTKRHLIQEDQTNDFSTMLGQIMSSDKWAFYMNPRPYNTRDDFFSAYLFFIDSNFSNAELIASAWRTYLSSRRCLQDRTKIVYVIRGRNKALSSQLLQITFENLQHFESYVVELVDQSEKNIYTYADIEGTTAVMDIDRNKDILDKQCLLTSGVNVEEMPLKFAIPSTELEPYHFSNETNGICFHAIKIITDPLNVTLEFFQEKEDEGVYQLIKGLQNNQIHLVCGSLIAASSIMAGWGANYLPVLMEDNVGVVLQKRREIQNLTVLVQELTPIVWALVFVVWLATGLLLKVEKIITKNRQDSGLCSILFRLFVGMISANPYRLSYRSFFWVFLLYVIVISSAYQSTLVTFLTLPRFERQFKNPREAILQGFKIQTTVSNQEVLSEASYGNTYEEEMDEIWTETERRIYHDTLSDAVGAVMKNDRSLALLTTEQAEILLTRYYMNIDGSFQADIIPFRCFTVQMQMVGGHHMFQKLAKNSLYMNEAGLITYYMTNFKWGTRQKSLRGGIAKPKKRPLSVSDISAILSLLVVNCLLSIVFFAVECCSKKNNLPLRPGPVLG